MPETRILSFLDRRHCPQYNTKAEIFVQDEHPSGLRHLVVQYEGGYEGRPEFAAAIPADWTEQDISDFLLRPMDPKSKYPAWEIPARLYGSPKLFRWWT